MTSTAGDVWSVVGDLAVSIAVSENPESKHCRIEATGTCFRKIKLGSLYRARNIDFQPDFSQS